MHRQREGVLFEHERLDMYQVGRELNREVARIVAGLPRGAGEAGDNLRRAAASITRNIAEANGKWTAADKAAKCYIARGSAMEVGAAVDELYDFRFLKPPAGQHAKELASRLVGMIMGRIRSLPLTEASSSLEAPPPRPPVTDPSESDERPLADPPL
jgi:four helix bundle protein